jgi:hypothetical protein
LHILKPQHPMLCSNSNFQFELLQYPPPKL